VGTCHVLPSDELTRSSYHCLMRPRSVKIERLLAGLGAVAAIAVGLAFHVHSSSTASSKALSSTSSAPPASLVGSPSGAVSLATDPPTPGPTPPGTAVLPLNDPGGSPLSGAAGSRARWELFPGDTAAATISSAQATTAAQHAPGIHAFLGPSSASVTWSSPTLARLQPLANDGSGYGHVGDAEWVVIASLVYSGDPPVVDQPNGVTAQASPLRHHYTVVLINAASGAVDGLWDLEGPLAT